MIEEWVPNSSSTSDIYTDDFTGPEILTSVEQIFLQMLSEALDDINILSTEDISLILNNLEENDEAVNEIIKKLLLGVFNDKIIRPHIYKEAREKLRGRINYKTAIGVDDCLEKRILKGLIKIANESTVRKIMYYLDHQDVPEVISDAVKSIIKLTGMQINFVILKTYSLDDKSEAFKMHIDPPEVATDKLLLLTLTGEAVLSCLIPGWSGKGCKKDFLSIPNRLYLVEPNAPHSTTPPLNGEERFFIFFGYTNNSPG